MINMTKKIVFAGIPLVNYALAIAIILLPSIVVAQEANQNVGARLTSGRLVSLVFSIVGIISALVAWRSMKRSGNEFATSNGKKGTIIALVLGLICVILSGLHLAKTTGGFGTGGGKAGSIVAVLTGALGVTFGAITLYRIRNYSKSN